MGVYLLAKLEDSSLILTGFREGGVILPAPPRPQNEPLKSPPRLGVSLRDNLPRIKTGVYVINLDDKKVKKRIGFHYLLTKMQMCT